MIKSRIQAKNKPAKYQYQYDGEGKTIGVFIPIKEWAVISKQYKGLNLEQIDNTKAKRKIKNGIVRALKEVEKHRQGKVKLQTAKDFIREMRKEL